MLHGQADDVASVARLKERHCFVTPDPAAAALDTRRQACLGGLSCGSELWRCPEMLFQVWAKSTRSFPQNSHG